MLTATIRKGHIQPIWAGHPWVYAQAIAKLDGAATTGAEVLVRDSEGKTLGRGLYSAGSAIPIRIYTRNPDEPVDAALFRKRIVQAIERRTLVDLPRQGTNAYRLLYGEGDSCPGLIVDRFADTLVLQFGTASLYQRRELIADVLRELTSASSILDRSSARAAKLEGFALDSKTLHGVTPDALDFEELGLRYLVPTTLRQKTGYYLDQREIRARIEALSQNRRVFDVYSYIGSFALAAARGGASEVVATDSSEAAIETARALAQKNELAERIRYQVMDAFAALQAVTEPYDLVILDPPKLAPGRADHGRATKLMRNLARAGVRATARQGLLLLCSCSHALGVDDLQRAAALGAQDLNRTAVVLERLFQGPDHPTLAAFPDGLYLSAVLLQIM